MTALVFFAVGILGITARSSYIEIGLFQDMPFSGSEAGGGVGAVEIVQTTLDHFGEPTIAGKTHSEILAMSRTQRYRWRKKISSEEKIKSQSIVNTLRYERISKALRGRSLSSEHRMRISQVLQGNQYAKGFRHTEESKRKMSDALKGRKLPPRSEEWSRKISESLTGKPSPHKGRKHTKEARGRMSEAHKGKVLSEEHREHISERLRGNQYAKGMRHSEETKKQISESTKIALQNPIAKEKMLRSIKEHWNDPENRRRHSERMTKVLESPEIRRKISEKAVGAGNGNWKGGVSFEPYCPAFNNQLKESIRNRDNRTCVLCGTGEIQNGRRLSVHHIDADKMQGCNHKNWYLCALCVSCNSKPDTVEKEFLIVTGGRSVQ